MRHYSEIFCDTTPKLGSGHSLKELLVRDLFAHNSFSTHRLLLVSKDGYLMAPERKIGSHVPRPERQPFLEGRQNLHVVFDVLPFSYPASLQVLLVLFFGGTTGVPSLRGANSSNNTKVTNSTGTADPADTGSNLANASAALTPRSADLPTPRSAALTPTPRSAALTLKHARHGEPEPRL